MANTEFPRGLFPLIRSAGQTLKTAYFLANTAADIFLGMPVDLGSDGLVAPMGVNTAGAIKTIGVVVGFDVNGASFSGDPFLDVSDLGNDTVKLQVCIDPTQEYLMQEDTGGSALTQADAGTVATIIYLTGSGSTSTGWANLMIDRSTVAASGSGQVQLLRLQEIINRDGTQNAAGNFATWVVRLLNNRYGLSLASLLGDPAV